MYLYNIIMIHYNIHQYVVTSNVQYEKSCTYISLLNVYIYVNENKRKKNGNKNKKQPMLPINYLY